MMQGCENPMSPVGAAGQPIEHKVEEKLGTGSSTRPPRSASFATSSLSRTSSSRRPASVLGRA
ncbi:MAG: hypothetical protein ACLU0O_00920 [Collinsella sp.]